MDRLKPATSIPGPAFRYAFPIRVRMADTDAQGIVYHGNYLTYCEAGRNEYMRDLELNYVALIVSEGMDMVVSEAWQKFRAPARFDDIIDVWVRVAQIRRVVLAYEYELRCRQTNTLLVTAGTELACLTRATRRPARVPGLLLDTIRAYEGEHLDDRAGRKRVRT